jgi:3-phytase
VRDDEGSLYVAESDVGLWSFNTDPERAGRVLAAPGLAPQDMALWLQARASRPLPVIPVAVPSAQTEPVRGGGDAADDPAIWIDAAQPSRSRILGTDKKRGLGVYDLQGRETQFLPVGRVNNVDVRQRLRYDGREWDLAVATQRDRRTVVLFGIDAKGRLSTLTELPTGLDEVYGICSARHPGGGLDVFVNDKDGRLIQMRVSRERGAWRSTTVATLKLATQPEGCVADEAGKQFFVGEEKRGLWRVALDAEGKLGDATLILPIGEVLHADVEGMAVHRGPRGAWLVVSSQGNDSYVVLDAEAPHEVKGRFRVGLNADKGIDAASETDGLDVTSASLGGAYGEGLLVVQDGHKRWPMGRQNFKLVPWSEVVREIESPAR